jgi:prepilin-type N-terminal cleavage/methylation domain-containing protein
MRRQAGLTLVELMTALAISSLMMVAALSAMSSLIRVRTFELKDVQRSPLAAPWRPVVSMDLMNATECQSSPQGFSLRTHAWLGRTSLDPRHLEAIVSYDVRSIAGRSWLVRTQESSFEGGTFTELVCPDVSAIRLLGENDVEMGPEGAVVPSVLKVAVESLHGGETIPVVYRRG